MITSMPRIAIATSDFHGIVTTFRERFGMPVADLSSTSVDGLGASLAMCVPEGGSNIELMSPADPAAPLSRSLQRFLDRRGEGLFALMLEAPVPDEEALGLSERGLEVLPLMEGAAGRDIHPRSAHGVLIRIYPRNSFQAAHDMIDRKEAADLGLSGVSRVIVAVADLDGARDVYGRGLGLPLNETTIDRERGLATAICHPPTGGVIELAAVVDAERPFAASVRDQLASRGEGMFALVLRAADPGAAGRRLGERGVPVLAVPGDGDAVVCDRVFGARILIEPS